MSDPRQKPFLNLLRKHGVIGPCLTQAGADRSDLREWLEDEEFAQAVNDAMEDAVDVAEMTLRQRAIDGLPEPIIYMGTVIPKRDPETGEPIIDPLTGEPEPLTVRKRSDDLLKTYVQANRAKYAQKGTQVGLGLGGNGSGGLTIEVNLMEDHEIPEFDETTGKVIRKEGQDDHTEE